MMEKAENKKKNKYDRQHIIKCDDILSISIYKNVSIIIIIRIQFKKCTLWLNLYWFLFLFFFKSILVIKNLYFYELCAVWLAQVDVCVSRAKYDMRLMFFLIIGEELWIEKMIKVCPDNDKQLDKQPFIGKSILRLELLILKRDWSFYERYSTEFVKFVNIFFNSILSRINLKEYQNRSLNAKSRSIFCI
jgi:hypothetical protein